jgi:hypothetical protein
MERSINLLCLLLVVLYTNISDYVRAQNPKGSLTPISTALRVISRQLLTHHQSSVDCALIHSICTEYQGMSEETRQMFCAVELANHKEANCRAGINADHHFQANGLQDGR